MNIAKDSEWHIAVHRSVHHSSISRESSWRRWKVTQWPRTCQCTESKTSEHEHWALMECLRQTSALKTLTSMRGSENIVRGRSGKWLHGAVSSAPKSADPHMNSDRKRTGPAWAQSKQKPSTKKKSLHKVSPLNMKLFCSDISWERKIVFLPCVSLGISAPFCSRHHDQK